MILCNFRIIEPRYQLEQEATLEWLALVHARAETRLKGIRGDEEMRAAKSRMSKLFRRYGCSSERIRTRGVEVPDFTHTDFETMEIYSLTNGPHGPPMHERSRSFRAAANRVGAEAYADAQHPPDHLIHVTCTGYVSPSCAQELVVRQQWHRQTTVTHAYHMGCYAALPAVRMAQGFLAAADHSSPRVDLLHTEICSLHVQTCEHSAEQAVVQSLFADGFIRYSAVSSPGDAARTGRGLQIVAMREELIPNSLEAMSWECTEWGMKMGLSRDVPALIADSLAPFVDALCAKARVLPGEIQAKAVWAIHPGGPKIIQQVKTAFDLTDPQISASLTILKNRGNMSSATLPHVWGAVLADPTVVEGTWVISLAFGPGLCVSGALARVVA